MLIRSQDRKCIVLFTLGASITIENRSVWNEIYIHPIDGYTKKLGEYTTEGRCMEILDDICDQYKQFVMFPGMGDNTTFQMPEE